MTATYPLAGARAALLDQLPRLRPLAGSQVAGGQKLISGKSANLEISAGLGAYPGAGSDRHFRYLPSKEDMDLDTVWYAQQQLLKRGEKPR